MKASGASLAALVQREPQADATKLRHTTLATAWLRFLLLAAKIWPHAGRTGVSYSDHYQEQGLFEQLMVRLRRIALGGGVYRAVLQPALKRIVAPPVLRGAVHGNLCTAYERNGAKDFEAGMGGQAPSGAR